MWLEIILLAVLIDFVVREPPGTRLNPVVWAGSLIENIWRKFKHKNPVVERIAGILFALTLISLCTAFIYLLLELLEFNNLVYLFASAIILKYCIAISAFFDTVKPVKEALIANNLPMAREHVKHLVTRDVSRLNEEGVISATIESIGENICDALISPLFYFMLFGVPGAVAMRIINLLDGCIGYKTPDKKYFGWFAARLDDVVQFIPARITSLLIMASAILIEGNSWNSVMIAFRDYKKDDGINSGWSIAAMAGALNVRLEKPDTYKMGDSNEKLNVKKINDALLFIPVTLIIFIISSILVNWMV
ncbi:MAG: cobalamin biosynthesis protein [Candidatus Altiarchaeales archaeon]|nr:cobalamin biosynthesis protein [Candidatus Altiarchaeota archaeon]MCG2782382.1 cobalamin biosynthesis protein [Candidatus Altiarchaeales archaeon]